MAVARRAALGGRGEDAAAAWYRRAGYEVLDRNWRCARRARRGGAQRRPRVLVFCEVKTRSSDRFGSPFEAVTPAKQRRSAPSPPCGSPAGAAGRTRYDHIRFDVAAVTNGARGALDVEVVVDAF